MKRPRISIVTPSFNQAAFLERTIESVLEQGYADLQYGVVDGGSTDGSIDIIERYRGRLDFVIIERDRGQCDAINKGMRRLDGDVVAYLNSDDTLLPGALDAVAERFAGDAGCDWLIGRCRTIDGDDRALHVMRPVGDFSLAGALLRDERFDVPQPAVFWRRSLMAEVGLFDESLHYCMDFEMWCRFLAAGRRPTLIERELATYRLHDSSKTCSQQAGFHRALIDIERRYLPRLQGDVRRRLRRKIGYQTRMMVANGEAGAVWPHVARRPWWLGSQQIRGALRCGGVRAADQQIGGAANREPRAAA